MHATYRPACAVAVHALKCGHHLVYSTCIANPGVHDLAADRGILCMVAREPKSALQLSAKQERVPGFLNTVVSAHIMDRQGCVPA